MRPITWVMAAWVALFVLLAAFVNPAGALELFLTFGLLVLLGLFAVSVLSKPKPRERPACGLTVARGHTMCGHCGFDFAAAAARNPSHQ